MFITICFRGACGESPRACESHEAVPTFGYRNTTFVPKTSKKTRVGVCPALFKLRNTLNAPNDFFPYLRLSAVNVVREGSSVSWAARP